MAEVQILAVEPMPPDPALFWGGGIDLPVAGERHDRYALIVAGWVSSRDTGPVDVEALAGDRLIGRWRSDRAREDVATFFEGMPVAAACGFEVVVNTLELPSEFELRFEAVGPLGRSPLGSIRGRRSARSARAEEGSQPILVTAMGRTGTSLLLHLLGQHPEVVVHPPFPYEARVACYWAGVIEALSSPPSYLQSLVSANVRRYWWLGHEAFPAATYLEQGPGARWLGGEALDLFADCARLQVRGFYGASEGNCTRGKSAAPRYFAEKRGPDPILRQLELELFPGTREIFLVRDFRDMLTSILAFNRKRGYHGFWRERVDSDDEYLALLGEQVALLRASWQDAARSRRPLLVRYEDLALDPRSACAAVLQWLEVEATPAHLDAMVRASGEVAPEAQRYHRTTPDAAASVGRWRRELPHELQSRCETLFGEALETFGYRPSP